MSSEAGRLTACRPMRRSTGWWFEARRETFALTGVAVRKAGLRLSGRGAKDRVACARVVGADGPRPRGAGAAGLGGVPGRLAGRLTGFAKVLPMRSRRLSSPNQNWRNLI